MYVFSSLSPHCFSAFWSSLSFDAPYHWLWRLTLAFHPSHSLLPFVFLYACDAQVLDLGVTQMLTRRLVLIFPYMCDGSTPICGSLAATLRIANLRLALLGRRSTARSIAPGYVRGVGDFFPGGSTLVCVSATAA